MLHLHSNMVLLKFEVASISGAIGQIYIPIWYYLNLAVGWTKSSYNLFTFQYGTT